ncbi:MAG: tRNA pseudouridine(55) synthase TruB, partial [Actinobacteria bacterium]|nr:tRNA pseudouridine(55) synthase TruB [Actinomycetota bacterium]
MDGVLVIDKPAGVTSHDVVDEVRRKLGTKKVGHGGTLDPDATGVLLIGVGRATRFLSYAQSAPKSYRAEIVFGVTTSTQDASGDVIRTASVDFGRERLIREIRNFDGEIDQIPPMVSAVRVDGERLYEKARRGEEVERAARRVTIYDLALVDFSEGDETVAVVDVRCSGGTYIRTLSHDLGEALGSGAHMRSLRRTAAGGFTLDEAVTIEGISPDALRPLIEIVRDLPQTEVSAEDAALALNGRPLF